MMALRICTLVINERVSRRGRYVCQQVAATAKQTDARLKRIALRVADIRFRRNVCCIASSWHYSHSLLSLSDTDAGRDG